MEARSGRRDGLQAAAAAEEEDAEGMDGDGDDDGEQGDAGLPTWYSLRAAEAPSRDPSERAQDREARGARCGTRSCSRQDEATDCRGSLPNSGTMCAVYGRGREDRR